MASKVAVVLSFKKVKVVLLLQELTSSIEATAVKVFTKLQQQIWEVKRDLLDNKFDSPPTFKSCFGRMLSVSKMSLPESYLLTQYNMFWLFHVDIIHISLASNLL